MWKFLLAKTMNKVYLSLGTNVGLRENNLSQAILLLKDSNDIFIMSESSTYKTDPLCNNKQSYFFNKVIEISTKLDPYKLLKKTQSIELYMGRDLTNSHNQPRIIDIDILVFENMNINSENLLIPHPRIFERRFVMDPWIEIAPHYVFAGQDLTIKELYDKIYEKKLKNQEIELV